MKYTYSWKLLSVYGLSIADYLKLTNENLMIEENFSMRDGL